MRARLALALTLMMVLVTGVVSAPAQAQPAAPVVGCEVDYQIAAQWGTGFQSVVTVTNTGDVPITWRVTIRFTDSTVYQGWNGVFTFDDQTVIIEPPAWYPGLLPGAAFATGLVGTGSGEPASIQVTCSPV